MIFFRQCLTLVLLILSTFIHQLEAIPSRARERLQSFQSLNPDHLPNLLPQQLFTFDVSGSSTTNLIQYESLESNHESSKLLGKRLEGPHRMFNWDLVIHFLLVPTAYSGYRTASVIGNYFNVPSSLPIRYLEKMYTFIRNAAINQWSKLPEQSFVRVVFGKLIFIILPPADRTVPWDVVEELAYMLLVFTAATVDCFLAGWYPFMISSSVVWFYLAVIAPGTYQPTQPVLSVPPDTIKVRFVIDKNGGIWRAQ